MKRLNITVLLLLGNILSSNAQTLKPFPESINTLNSRVTIADVKETPHDRHIRYMWLASIGAMVGATTLDAYSSWHKQESNGLLASSNGQFGGKGVALKAGITSGVLLPQILLRKHKDWRTTFAVSNFAEAGIFAGAAVHNFGVK